MDDVKNYIGYLKREIDVLEEESADLLSRLERLTGGEKAKGGSEKKA